MQRIELLEEVGQKPLIQEGSAEPLAAEDLITDEVEIRNIIRRAVTISWQDCVFSLDELADRLGRNGVVLPTRRQTRNEYLMEAIEDLWHQQKELARVALQPLPTLVRTRLGQIPHYGIVIPMHEVETAAVVEAPLPSIEAEEVVVDLPVISAEAFQEKLHPLDRAGVARAIIDKLMSESRDSPRFLYGDFVAGLKNSFPGTESATCRSVLRALVENGYVQTYPTGRKRKKHSPDTWVEMSVEIRDELLAEIEDSTLDSMLETVFGTERATA